MMVDIYSSKEYAQTGAVITFIGSLCYQYEYHVGT